MKVKTSIFTFDKFIIAVLLGAACWPWAHGSSVKESLEFISSSKDYIDLKASSGLAIDLRHASVNNFMGKNLYGEFNR